MVKKPLKNKLLVEKKELVDATKSETKAIVLPRKNGRPIEWTEELIEQEATLLLEYANDPNSIVIGKHYGSRGYSYHDAIEWAEKNAIFRQAKVIATQMIASRREELGLKGVIDAGIVKATLATYDLEHRKALTDMKTVLQLKAQGASGESVSVQVISFDSASDN